MSKQSNLTKFSNLCHYVNFNSIDELFVVSTTNISTCSVCDSSVDNADPSVVLVHLHILAPTDKLQVHGTGVTLHAAKENAAMVACILLESLDAELFTLRKQRLRLRLEDFGVSIPKSSAMQILEDENDPNRVDDGFLPIEFQALANLISNVSKDEEEPSTVIIPEELLAVSEAFLRSILRYTLAEVEGVVCKIGLTMCDEISRNFNPFLLSSLVALFLRLDGKKFLTNNEKLTLSFCKIMEQILLLHVDIHPLVSLAVARLIRAFIAERCVPFMSKNRLETLAIRLSKGGIEYVTYLESDVNKFPQDDLVLEELVLAQSPSAEYLTNLIGEFGNVNRVIHKIFNVDGQIYGSLVNGFPTKSSDIDVVVNLPDKVVPQVDDEEDHRNLVELGRLHEGLLAALDSGEWIVNKIESARVPILICKKGNLEVNISFNHQVVIENSKLLSAYSSISPKIKQLVVLVKFWAKQRAVNDSLQGTLSSYSFVLLVISFLQVNGLVPNLQHPNDASVPVLMDNDKCSVWFLSESDPSFESVVAPFRARLENWSLKKLFVRFFEHYLYRINYITDVVSIGGWAAGPVAKKQDLFERETFRRRTWFTIADPFEINRFLGTSARGTELLIKEMLRGVELVMNGEFKNLFRPYSRNEGHRYPPFPLRELSQDAVVYKCHSSLRMNFVWDPTLIELTNSVTDPVLLKNLCYLSNRGLPSDTDIAKHSSKGASTKESKDKNRNNRSSKLANE